MTDPTKGLSGHEATASDCQRGKGNLQSYQVREEHSRVKIIPRAYTYLYLCRKLCQQRLINRRQKNQALRRLIRAKLKHTGKELRISIKLSLLGVNMRAPVRNS